MLNLHGSVRTIAIMVLVNVDLVADCQVHRDIILIMNNQKATPILEQD